MAPSDPPVPDPPVAAAGAEGRSRAPVSGLWAVLPVKGLDHAKSRLAGVLDDHLRRGLATRLLTDTLRVLQETPAVAGVVVVTRHAEVRRRAAETGAEVVDEPSTAPQPAGGPDARGAEDPHGPLNRALEAGRQRALERGASILLSLPLDLLLLPGTDLDALLRSVHDAGGTDPGIHLCADDRGDGTNLLVQRPADAIPFRYGPGSARRHQEEAQERGLPVHRIPAPQLGWDVDAAEDPRRWGAVLAGDPELQAVFRASLGRGTALRFLLATSWAEPLRPFADPPRRSE